MIWTAVLVASLACFALKALGFVVPERAVASPAVARLVAMIPIALLSALLAVVTVGRGMSVTVDARLAGLAAAAVALALRAPFLLVVMLGAATAAIIRAV